MADAEPQPEPDVVEDDVAPEPAGTGVAFDLDADWSQAEAFFDFPYPSDLRLGAEGTPDLMGFPNALGLPLIDDIKATAMQRRGFPVIPVAWFRFSSPLAERTLEEVVLPGEDAPLLLVDVDPGSPERGRMIPVVAQTFEVDPHVPEGLLAVAPRPGLVLEPERRYAFVVRTSLGDAEGEPLVAPEALVAMAAGERPEGERGEAALALYGSLFETLGEVDVEEIAAATVFTTGDVVADFHAMSEAVLAEHSPELEDVGLIEGGAEHERFCVLEGSILFPQFQRGEPPFDSEGLFEEPPPGEAPVVQREESVPVALVLPKSPMPAEGYPMVVYFHGSGGLTTQVVDRGPITEPDGEKEKGKGPAHVLAAHGFASVGPALPVNPQRVEGAGGRGYINLLNLKSYRDNFRQGTLEHRMLLRALVNVAISPEALGACEGPELPEGVEAFGFAEAPIMAMGQSQGAIYANMLTGLDPLIRGAAPTGAGGFWSHQLLINQEDPIGPIVERLLQVEGLTWAHPTMHLLQTAWEVVDPVVYMPRMARNPLPGHAPRSVYQPVGQGDTFYPTPIFDTLALAFGHQQAGEEVWPQMQQALALSGLDGLVDYPVSENLTSADGTPYTGVVVQYEGDGIANPHSIFAQLDAVKHQYGCFLETLRDTGVAVLPAPAPLGTPCEQP